jgi:hypothetical protein
MLVAIGGLTMTRFFAITAVGVFTASIMLPTELLAAGSHSRRGHVTKKGTYVAPSRATNPNRTQRDNYSSKPNVNPYSGKQGTRTPTK